MHKHTNTLFVKQWSPKGQCAWAQSFRAAKTTALMGQAGICSPNHWGGCQIQPNTDRGSLMLLGFANSTTNTRTHMYKQTDEGVFPPRFGPRTLTDGSHFEMSFLRMKRLERWTHPRRGWCLQVNTSSLYKSPPRVLFFFFYRVMPLHCHSRRQFKIHPPEKWSVRNVPDAEKNVTCQAPDLTADLQRSRVPLKKAAGDIFLPTMQHPRAVILFHFCTIVSNKMWKHLQECVWIGNANKCELHKAVSVLSASKQTKRC